MFGLKSVFLKELDEDKKIECVNFHPTAQERYQINRSVDDVWLGAPHNSIVKAQIAKDKSTYRAALEVRSLLKNFKVTRSHPDLATLLYELKREALDQMIHWKRHRFQGHADQVVH